MGVDVERGPVTNLDNKLLEEEETNKLTRSSSIAEKTAKLHRLLGDSDKEKGFHLGEISYKAKLDYGNLEIFLSSDLNFPSTINLSGLVGMFLKLSSCTFTFMPFDFKRCCVGFFK